MPWVLEKEEAEALQELNSASDRAAGIVAATILERRLKSLLKRLLLDYAKNSSTSIHLDMFRASGPFGSFSSKINLTYMLGICSTEAWRDLDYIREIRNEFAHIPGTNSFKSQRVADLCRNLKKFELHIFPDDTKDAAMDISPKIFEANLTDQLASPRQRYLLCVRFYTGLFSVYPTAHPTPPLCITLC
jgi:DNA-binding MltR family transcriptional regulator